MMRKSLYIIIGVTLVLLSVSCGQQHQAKQVIQDFVDQYATEPSTRSSISITKFDSTRVLNDSVIMHMRANADTIQRYHCASRGNQPIKYADNPAGKKLFVARVSYAIDDTEYSDTYYLDEDLSGVVAFKSNGIQEKEGK
jgi:hypothetical protein